MEQPLQKIANNKPDKSKNAHEKFATKLTNLQIETREAEIMAKKKNVIPRNEPIDGNLNKKYAPSQILDHIYLGDYGSARQESLMKNMKVGWILNTADECPILEYSQISSLQLVVEDHLINGNQFGIFEKAFQFIDQAKNSEKTCYVHCMRGRSRSASIVIAYLMNRNKMALREAYEHVKERRRCIGPHQYLRRQLIDYEIHLYGNTSLPLHEWSWDSY